MKKVSGISRSRRGFSLLEIMVTIGIIGMMATLAVPSIREATRAAKVMRTASDLRHYATAINTYNLANGKYPVDGYPGDMPQNMDGIMPYQFVQDTPMGGQWDWDYGQFSADAAISIYNNRASVETYYLWWRLDKMMDDGAFLGGKMRYRSNGYMYVLSENGE